MSKQENKSVQKIKEQDEDKLLSVSEVKVLLKQQEEHIIQSITIQKSTVRSGPIPEAQELREYKQVDKTFPSRIMEMAEKEQSFRHRATFLGQINFIALIIIGFGMSILAGIFTHWSIGIAIATGTSYIAYVFKSKNPDSPKAPVKKEEEIVNQ